jgi:hypothetical protein
VAAKTPKSKALGRARLIGTGLFGTVVAVLTIVFSVQIILQAWDPGALEPNAQCHEGLRTLLSALDRARQSAAKHSAELEAVAAFRAELTGTWDAQGALATLCAKEPQAARLLREIHALRYAEEQAVRRDAHELSRTRLDVQQLASKLLGLY